MRKGYIIAVVIAIAAFIGFMAFRHYKKSNETARYADDTRNQIVEAAKSSRTGGLVQMGIVLNRYYKENKKYPERLDELYPNYLDSKAFIDEIEWKYTPKGDNFILNKSTLIDNVKMAAHIDKNLIPRAGSDIMVASINAIDSLITSREDVKLIPTQAEIKKPRDTGIQTKEVKIVQPLKPEIVSVSEGEIGSGVAPEVGDIFLVWKDDKGHLGFGNREYPIAQRLSTYSKGQWSQLKMSLPPKESLSETAGAQNGDSINSLTTDAGGKFLVWKNPKGTMGFGNVNYPSKDTLSILNSDKSWSTFDPTPVKEPGTISTEIAPSAGEEPAVENGASEQKKPYLVWRDQNGNIGFGNVLYPESNALYIYDNNEWVKIEKPSPAETHADMEKSELSEKGKRIDEIAADFGERYIIWKDIHGNVGFGDALGPNADRVSIYADHQWVGMEKADDKVRESDETEADSRKSEKDTDEISKRLSESYLVWKDRSGHICYGNVQYPTPSAISDIYVDGNWQKVTEN